MVYSNEQIFRFIDYMLEHPGSSRAQSGREVGVPPRFAQRWWNPYVETGKMPYKKESVDTGRPLTFMKEHKDFINNFVKNKPNTVIDEIMENLTAQFTDFKISRSGLHRYMKENLTLTVKGATFQPVARNSAENIEERYQWYLHWQNSDLDFVKNCVFIDEAVFTINMKSNWAWSKKGTKAIGVIMY